MKNILKISIMLFWALNTSAQNLEADYYHIPQPQKSSYGFLLFKIPVMNVNFLNLESEVSRFGGSNVVSSFPILEKRRKVFGVKLPSFHAYQRIGGKKTGVTFEVENHWNMVNENAESTIDYDLRHYKTFNNLSYRVGVSSQYLKFDYGITHVRQRLHQAEIINIGGEEMEAYYQMEHRMAGVYLKAMRIKRLRDAKHLKCAFDLAAFVPYQSTYYSPNDTFDNGDMTLVNPWIPSAQASLLFTGFNISSVTPKPVYWLFEIKGNYYNQQYETAHTALNPTQHQLIHLSANFGIGLRW